MITRIVKLTFDAGKIDDFLELFESNHRAIAAFNGCRSLKLLQWDLDERVFFTVSTWESAKALEDYRNSELFRRTWSQTKALFADKPRAWSTAELFSI